MESKDSIRVCIFGDERVVHTRRWVEGLRGLGIKVDLVTLIKEREFDIGGISLGAKSKMGYFSRIGKLRSLVDRMKPDIFHAHHASSYGFLASFVNHPKKILSVWGNDVIVFPFENFIFRKMVRRSLKKAHRITATSKFLEHSVRKLDPEIAGIEIIPFGIDIGKFNYVERTEREIIEIGIAKSMRPKYGIDYLIKAFKILAAKHKNIRLSIAGKGEHADKYKGMVNKYGLGEIVKFMGFISHEKLPEYLSGIDIFAMPSISDGESFGVAALEASSTGLPVVASEVGGVPEVVMNGKTGFLVPKMDAGALADALEKLIINADLRREMGRAGRQFVEESYRWEDNLKSMRQLYQEMMG